MEQRHYRRIREKALAEAGAGVPPKPDRTKPILLVVGLAMVALAVFALVRWVMPDPDRVQKPDQVVEEPIDIGLSTNDMEALLLSFLEAESVEELLEVVDHPEVSEPRIRKFYEEGRGELPLLGNYMEIRPIEYDGEEVKCALVKVFGTISMVPFNRGEDGLPQLEWEAVVGWMDPSLEEILASNPEAPVEVKVFGVLDDYYNYEFRDEKKWACVRLSDRNLGNLFYAYFDRADERFRPLLDLEVGDPAPMTIELKFGVKREFSQAEITEFRTFGWTGD